MGVAAVSGVKIKESSKGVAVLLVLFAGEGVSNEEGELVECLRLCLDSVLGVLEWDFPALVCVGGVFSAAEEHVLKRLVDLRGGGSS